jgi:hypothetical protein
MGVAPFGSLPFQEYGKPVVHLIKKGVVRRHTPLLGAHEANITVRTAARLTSDGRLSGTGITTATGPFSVVLRQLAANVEAVGEARAVQEILHRAGASGTGSLQLDPPYLLAPNYTIATQFELEPNLDLLSGRPFSMPAGMRMASVAGDILMGPLFFIHLSDDELTPCYQGHASETLSLELPKNKRLVRLPDDQTIRTSNIMFAAHWSFKGQVVQVTRDFVSHLDTPLCSGLLRRETAAALHEIAASYAVRISLQDD